MKKSLVLFTTLLLLLTGMMFTSCQHSYVADEDTWYCTNQTVGGENFEIWFYYTTKDSTPCGVAGTIPAGLTVAITPSNLLVKTYDIKTFAKSTNNDGVPVDENDESVKIKVTGTTMDALYVYYKQDFRASATTTLPYFLQTGKGYTKVTDMTNWAQGLSWKEIIKQVVNNVL